MPAVTPVGKPDRKGCLRTVFSGPTSSKEDAADHGGARLDNTVDDVRSVGVGTELDDFYSCSSTPRGNTSKFGSHNHYYSKYGSHKLYYLFVRQHPF